MPNVAWTVTPINDDDVPNVWEIRADRILIETVPSHYDAWEVLTIAESCAKISLAWRLTDSGGFIST